MTPSRAELVLQRRLDQAKRLVQVCVFVLFAYISLVPYYYFQEQRLTQDLPAFSLAKYLPFVLVCLMLLVWLSEVVTKRRTVGYSRIYGFIGVYLGISLVSLIGAEYARIGLVKWIYYHTTGCVLCLLITQYFREWQAIRRLALFIGSISGVVVLYTFICALWGADPIWGTVQDTYNPYYTHQRATGPFGHTVATATYTMFLMPLAIWMGLAIHRSAGKILWGTGCALYLPVILLTQTRGTLLAAGASVLLMAPWLRTAGRALRRIDRRIWAIGGGITVVVLLVLGRAGEIDRLAVDRLGQVKERWRHILEPRSVTIKDGDKEYHYGSLLEYTERFRIAQYHTVGNILKEHPVLGVGFGTFTRVFDQYKYTDNYMEREFSEHTTENMYLIFLAETGWAGLASSLALMGAILVLAFRAYGRLADSQQRHLLLAYLAGSGGLVFNMLTWDILNEPTLRMTYWILTGLALAASCPDPKRATDLS